MSNLCPTCLINYQNTNNNCTSQDALDRFKPKTKASGDWVVLIPDKKSAEKLEMIAKTTSKMVGEMTANSVAAEAYSASQMHLSLSTSYEKFLNKEESENLLKSVKDLSIPQFSSKMEKGYWKKTDDVFKLQFTGINYQPYMTLTSTRIADSQSEISQLMKSVDSKSVENNLLPPGTANNHTQPHFSIGKVNENSLKAVHNAFFNCDRNMPRNDKYDRIIADNAQALGGVELTITFSEIAILRVVHEEGKASQYFKVGYVNLTENPRKTEVFDNPQPWGMATAVTTAAVANTTLTTTKAISSEVKISKEDAKKKIKDHLLNKVFDNSKDVKLSVGDNLTNEGRVQIYLKGNSQNSLHNLAKLKSYFEKLVPKDKRQNFHKPAFDMVEGEKRYKFGLGESFLDKLLSNDGAGKNIIKAFK